MTVYGRGGKPEAGFPPRPQTLEIANGAIPTFPRPRRADGKVEIQKQDSHFPTGAALSSSQSKERSLAADRFAPASRLILPENQIRVSGSFLDENMLRYRCSGALDRRLGRRITVPHSRR
jgi:hypothetical protein